MPKGPLVQATAAFSVDRVRAQMLEGIVVPKDLLQKAIDKVHKKLDAKTTKFFTHQGSVVEQVDVEDHAIQLAAAEKVFSIAGVYAREKDTVAQQPSVVFEIDKQTGIVRLVIGGNHLPDSIPPISVGPGGASVIDISDLPPAIADRDAAASPVAVLPIESREEEPPQVVKVRRGTLPASVHSALFGDDV